METITVIPLKWKDNKKYDFLANELTRSLVAGVKRSKIYKFIDPAVLSDIDKSDYWQYVDVYIDCEIIDIKTEYETEKTEENDSDKTKTKKYNICTVTVNIEYKYISAIDNKVLGSFNKTAQAKEKYDNSGKSIIYGLVAFLVSGETLSNKIAIKAVRDFSFGMYEEVNPYKTIERKRILQSTSNNTAFKEAEKLVRQKKYNDALFLYKKIYEETGSAVACYNMAILLEFKKQFIEALALLEDLDEKLANKNIDAHPFITEEIENLKSIINGLILIEDYTNK
jgi:tetratricopeptide (TPR) repeat protein